MEDVKQTIQSQYATSPKINAVADIFNLADPAADISLFRESIFDVDTAKGVGLDIWARIVAMQREFYIDSAGTCFGFRLSELLPFDQGIFYNGVYYTAGTYAVSDSALYRLILWKAKANIGDVSIRAINQQLGILFSDDDGTKLPVYARETGVMEVQVTVVGSPKAWQTLCFNAYKNILFGAGVNITFRQVAANVFGFNSRTGNTFGHSVFYNDN